MALQPPALEPLDPSATYYATFLWKSPTDDLGTAIGIERRIPDDVPDHPGVERFAAFTWCLRWEPSTFLVDDGLRDPGWPFREITLDEAEELVKRLYDEWLQKWRPPPDLEPLDPDATYYAVFKMGATPGGVEGAVGMRRRYFQDDPLPRGTPRYASFTKGLKWEHTNFFFDVEEGWEWTEPYREISLEEAEEFVKRMYAHGLENWPPYEGQ